MVKFDLIKNDLKFKCNYENGVLLAVPDFKIETGVMRKFVEGILEHLQTLFLCNGLEEKLVAGETISLKFYDIVVY